MTRRALAVLASCLGLAAAQAGEFDAWVPPGWKLLQSATGDLDRDRRADAVLVLEADDATRRIANDGLGPPVLNLNPRRLTVLLQRPQGYVVAHTDDETVPPAHSRDEPCLADPVQGDAVAVRRGLLVIRTQDWSSCGSYGVATDERKYRHEAGRFRLIGLDHRELMRSSGAISEVSIDFLTGRVRTTTGLSEGGPSRPKTRWSRLRGARDFVLGGRSPLCRFDALPAVRCD